MLTQAVHTVQEEDKEEEVMQAEGTRKSWDSHIQKANKKRKNKTMKINEEEQDNENKQDPKSLAC